MDCHMIIRWCFRNAAATLEGVNGRDSLLAALVATVWGFNLSVIGQPRQLGVGFNMTF